MQKTIIFLEQYGTLGGAQQVLLELVQSAKAEGLNVLVFIPDGPCVPKLTALGAIARPIPKSHLTQGKKSLKDIAHFIWYNLQIFCRKAAMLRQGDLIYVNGNRLLLVALLVELLLARDAVFHIHLNHGRLEKWLFRQTLYFKRTKALIVPSTFIARELTIFSRHFSGQRLRLVENGLDVRFADVHFVDRFSGNVLRQVGIVGRVSPEKGQDVLLPLARSFPHLHFHVLGDAAFSEEDYYARLQVEAPANVQFHGWVDDLPAKVREIGLQVCLVPSRCPTATPERSFEAAPLVPLQMAALGCLVVVRRLGALEDLARNLDLLHFDTDEEISGCLQRLQEGPSDALAERSRATYATVMARYGHTAFQDRLRALLHDFCTPC